MKKNKFLPGKFPRERVSGPGRDDDDAEHDDDRVKTAVQEIHAEPAFGAGEDEVLPMHGTRQKAHVREDRALRLQGRAEHPQ